MLNALYDIDFLSQKGSGLITRMHLCLADYFYSVNDSGWTVFSLDNGSEAALTEIFHDFETALQVFDPFNLAHAFWVDFKMLTRVVVARRDILS